MIIAIDPGPVESAYVEMDEEYRPQKIGTVRNEEMLAIIPLAYWEDGCDEIVIEMVASYGMPVGAEVFETVFWIGRYFEAAKKYWRRERIYRIDVKNHLCHSSRAKDGNIRQALIDRFGVVGTKKDPGWFYGFKADIWQAYAVGVTYLDRLREAGGNAEAT